VEEIPIRDKLIFNQDGFGTCPVDCKSYLSISSMIYMICMINKNKNWGNPTIQANEIQKSPSHLKISFGTKALHYIAPGRINLIGEHADYNEFL